MRALRPPTRALLCLAVLTGAAGMPGAARAQETALSEGGDKLPAVQNRLYRLEHEVKAGVGVLPVNAFYKGVSFSGGYAWHLDDLWAVEGSFSYLHNIKTDLREKLENNIAIPATRFTELLYFGQVGAMFKPIYGKLSLLNRTLVYGELFFSLSGVVGRITGGKGEEGTEINRGERMAFGAAPGFGLRGFLSERLSLRFDFRYMLLYADGGGHFPLSLSLSLAFTTRSDS